MIGPAHDGGRFAVFVADRNNAAVERGVSPA
jgi:hypothetical protein